jgi:hypothetical protein
MTGNDRAEFWTAIVVCSGITSAIVGFFSYKFGVFVETRRSAAYEAAIVTDLECDSRIDDAMDQAANLFEGGILAEVAKYELGRGNGVSKELEDLCIRVFDSLDSESEEAFNPRF